MLFVNEKYRPLNTFLEEDEIMNEAERYHSDYKHLREFLDKHKDKKSVAEILLYLCDEHDLNEKIAKLNAGLDEGDKYNISKWWKENKKNGNDVIPNKYIIKQADKNAAIYSTKHVIKGVDDIYTLLSKDFKVDKIQDLSSGGAKVKVSDEDGDYVTVNIDYTGKDALNNKGSAFPSATEMEMVIAFAYNKNYGIYKGKSDDEIADFVGIDNKNKYKYFAFYNGNTQMCEKMASLINKGCRSVGFPANSLKKMQNKDVGGVTRAWVNAGGFGNGKKEKPNLTPKTDLISEDGRCKLSLKNADEGAQAMSGGFRESRATMMCVLAKLFSNYKEDVNGIKLSSLSAEINDALKDVEGQAASVVNTAKKRIDKQSKEFINQVSNLFKEIKYIKDDDALIGDVTSSKNKNVADAISFAVGSWLDSTSDKDLDVKIQEDPKLKAFLKGNNLKTTTADIVNYVNSIISKTSKNSKDKLVDAASLTKRHIKQYVHRQMATELCDILNKNEDFRKAVMREAMTGEIKYGINSPATANAVLVWSYNGDCKIEDIYEYADKHSRMSSSDKLSPEEMSELIDPTINFKGSSGKSYSAMRIGMKKTKLHIDIDKVISELNDELVEAEKQEEDDLNKALKDELRNSIEIFNKMKLGDGNKSNQSNEPAFQSSAPKPRGRSNTRSRK